ncbi:MAG: DegT/DnrJ/EryC1/StrS family aminotransferase [Proteobacteria bacterium]|nr:DegT/DnrJ/EryC1/StrS family aminotransferase [Pseudomonadota bacterium]
MKFIDLEAQYRLLEPAIRQRIDAVLAHGKFIMGPEVAELEAILAAQAQARHCITCSSGTDALLMPLMAWNIGPGDAVFVPSFTFFATAEVVALTHATPVFVDCDPVTFNMDPAALKRAIQAVLTSNPTLHPLPRHAHEGRLKPRAVIPVDLFGAAADYNAILPLAHKHGLLVLEDAAQAFGGSYHGKPVCGLGCDVAATSFFPAKPLGCYGDGGAVFTDDDDLAEKLRSVRVHGKGDDKYENVRIGLNARMDTLQAAIMLPKALALPAEIEARQRIAARYAQGLEAPSGVTAPKVAANVLSAWAQYTLRFDDNARRDAVAAHLKEAGVPTAIYYPRPLHTQAAFRKLGYQAADLPVTVDLCQRVLSLPFHPYLEAQDQDRICGLIAQALG